MPIPEEVQSLIDQSGNNFHSKVAKWFTDNGWAIIISPYYMDQSQNKPREIDLIAERSLPYSGNSDDPVGEVAIRLFIECKYIPQYSAFWFADKDKNAATELVCATSPFSAGNSYTKKHHYLSSSDKVAKLFASSKDKLTENEPFYKALNQGLNAMVSLRRRPIVSLSRQHSRHVPTTTLEMPVIICNSFEKLYGVNFYDSDEVWNIDTPFQLEVDYAYQDTSGRYSNEYFLLDIVSYDQLSGFCKVLDEDTQAAADLLSD